MESYYLSQDLAKFEEIGKEAPELAKKFSLPDERKRFQKRCTCPVIPDGFQGSRFRAVLGIRTASSIFLTTMSAVAVIPGRRDKSGLSTFSTVS